METVNGGGQGGGQFFVVDRFNGKKMVGSLTASRSASFGRGANLVVDTVQHPVPAGPAQLELAGRVAYAAPVQEIFSAVRGRMYAVTGKVEVDLKAGRTYRINGVLDELRSEVWIEDEETHALVAPKIVGAASDEARKVAAAPPRFACCNLRVDDDWIGDAGEVDGPFVPAGTPIRVFEFKKDRVRAAIGDKPMRIGIDEGAKQHTIAQLVDKLAVADDPARELATWPAPVQAAVRGGKIRLGMTRAQVLMALGFPRIDFTPDLSMPTWRYAASNDRQLMVVWGAADRVDSIEAPAAVKAAVTVPQE